MYKRNKTRQVKVGNLFIGGGNPIIVQSMTNTITSNVDETVKQIKKLEEAGCELVRVAVPDIETAKKLENIKKLINIPLVADIHFDYRIALIAIDQGVDKLRINPGNIGSKDKVEKVVVAAKNAKIPIRIGVNAGSLKNLHNNNENNENFISFRANELVKSAMDHIQILESYGFYDIIVSLKASDIATTVEAYRLFSLKSDYPLHLGITESGSIYRGLIKSSAGLGVLLYDGLGDTIRVSLTADPVEEIKAGFHILQSLELRSTGVDLISCPTCSRCEVDLIKIVNELEKELFFIRPQTSVFLKKSLKVAVMGCVVNGPGEAMDSDIGIAGGKKDGILFENGKIIGRVKPEKWVKTLIEFIKKKSLESKNE